MKNYCLFLITFFLAQSLHGQNDDFYFTVIRPSNIYQTLAPGEYGTGGGTGWGWDGTIPNDFFAEMVYVSEGLHGIHSFCEENSIDYTGKVVLVERGICDFSEKAFNAQQQGAIAVVIRNFEDNLIHMGPGEFAPEVTIPCIMITASAGENLVFELLNGVTVIVGFTHTANPILRISGSVVRDDNLDCVKSLGETFLKGWKIYTQGPNGFSTISYSDANGHYQLFVDTGSYEIHLIAPNTSWQACPPITVSSSEYDSVVVDLQAQVLINCPMLTIDIEVPLLRRCFDNNTFKVHYCNQGTTTAESAFATVQFDNLISVVSSSLAFTELGNNTYEFSLGDIEVDDCGSFTITTLVSCDTELSQTLCAFANIYPQDNCDTGGETYNGPSVRVTGQCTGTQVAFQIENTGEEDMSAPGAYRVFKNAKIVETGNFHLMAGQSKDIAFPADGATYRLEADQANEYPEVTSPGSTIEACANGTDDFQTGFFNMLPPADYGVGYDETCLTVIGSFDPNDKTPTPLGYGIKHYIERNTDLHYLIRFQNTGTDTAFNIIVRDKLSGSFDISSLELGVASHDYSFSLLDNHIIEFRFNNVLLPDSNVNETASHGYLTYQLKQNDFVNLGDVVRNSAAIYFDFNEPVITNETFHTIGENFIGITGTETLDKNISLQVYPNPMKDFVIFKIENTEFQEGRLELYNGIGQLIRVEKTRENTFEVKRKDLQAGSYFFRLALDDQLSASGVIQVLGNDE